MNDEVAEAVLQKLTSLVDIAVIHAVITATSASVNQSNAQIVAMTSMLIDVNSQEDRKAESTEMAVEIANLAISADESMKAILSSVSALASVYANSGNMNPDLTDIGDIADAIRRKASDDEEKPN